MALAIILILSLGLLIGITYWCHAQGLFAPGSMGFGLLAAAAVYVFFWALPTAAVTGLWFVLGR